MLNVESIQNGIVIDHITAGKGLEIDKFLHLENISRSIALLQYVKSEKYGKKDLIKIEGSDTLPQLDILGYLDDKNYTHLYKRRQGRTEASPRPADRTAEYHQVQKPALHHQSRGKL